MTVKGDKIVSEATKSLPVNMSLQFALRSLSFIANALLVRSVSKNLLGLANVRLQLLYSTVLFLSREPFRRALPAPGDVTDLPSVMMAAWLCIPLSVVFSLVTGAVWYFLLEVPEEYLNGYHWAVGGYTLAAFIELLVEPIWLLSHLVINFKLRMKIEGVAALLRTVTVLIGVHLLHDVCDHCGVLAFAIGQLVHAGIYAAAFTAYLLRDMDTIKSMYKLDDVSQLLPHRKMMHFHDRGFRRLTVSFLKQSMLKHLLTEGERFIMSFFDLLSLAQQGVFDVVSNIGSLVARLLFLPLEETAYLIFSQLLARGDSIQLNTPETRTLVTRVFTHLLKLVIIIALLAAGFGPSFSGLALQLYAGSDFVKGSSAVVILETYCFFIALLAINGITEAFVFAAMNSTSLERYNRGMSLFSIVFVLSSIMFVRLFGAVGFIYGNMLNFAVRVLFSLYWIEGYYGSSLPLLDSLPRRATLLTFAGIYLTLAAVKPSGEVTSVLHFGTGVVCGLTALAVLRLYESDTFLFVWRLIRDKTPEKVE